MGKRYGIARAVIALALLAWHLCAFALDPSLDVNQYAHTAWKVRDGFAKGAIRAIAQTSDGYLWLGTEFGLLRFDGVRALPWQAPPGQPLPSNTVSALLVTRDGTLWIGTTKGLASWKDGKLLQYHELAGLLVLPLIEDHEGTVWAGGYAYTPPGKLCAIQKGSVHCYGNDGSLGNGVQGLYEDRRGNLWAGVADGLWHWKPGLSKFYPLAGAPWGVQALGEDLDGTLLIGMGGRVVRFLNGKTEAAYLFPGGMRQSYSWGLLRDRDGGLWIGTAQGFVHLHQGRTDIFAQSDGLSADDVEAIFEDREGNIWVATMGGLDRFRNYAATTYSANEGLASALEGSVLAAKDESIWLGTGNFLGKWNNGQVTIYHAPGTKAGDIPASANGRVRKVTVSGLPKHLEVLSLFQDDRGRIWIAANGGFGYLENEQLIAVDGVPGGSVYSMAGDSQGNLWVANFDRGLFHLFQDKLVRQVPWAALGREHYASALAVDPSRGGLWLGGFDKAGVAYFADGQIRASYTTTDGLGQGRINSLRLDPDGTLWASTEGGLSRVKDGRVATLTSKNGLPCDTVHWSIEDDDRSVWLYAACGLVRIAHPQLDAWVADPKRTIQATVFDGSDGVGSAAYQGVSSSPVAKSSDGKLWFTTWEGVSVLDPHHIPFNKLPAPVHIEQIIADGKNYDTASDANENVRLPPRIRDLEIDYTALSFVASEKVLFRYKLEGWDRDWLDAGNRRQAFYSNLPPRDYRFRVMACNNSGVWNEAGTFLDFSIAPAYYQTNWFRTLCAAAFLGLLWGSYQLRVQQLKREERKLRGVVETIPTFAWTALPNGSVDFVNRHWQEYTGLSAEKTVGSGWQAAVQPEDLERHAAKWRASLASGEPFESEVRYRRAADGEYRWFLTRAVPLRDGRGKIVKWYGTSTDIEDRKRAEQLQADLAHMNRVATMDELTASLAHEIKQPIGAAVTNAEACARLLDRDQLDVLEARETALEMAKNARRAAYIIDRVRSLYRKGSSRMDAVEVNEVIGEMLLLLHNEANRHSVSIRTDLTEGLPTVTADRVQLQQVLMNLMLNGIQAMEKTGGALTIKSQLDQEGRVLISVSDTGVGLPTDKADEIFNAFFTTKPEGSGMGLTISRSILESHGGRLWATANDGHGATFHFTLPITAHVVQEPATGT